MTLPAVRREREPLTMAEARAVGAASNRLRNFRHLLSEGLGGSLTVRMKFGTTAQALTTVDMEAILSLLIEREELFLGSFNVDISE